jgi:5-hydroxyisourate hydrolase
VSFSVQVIDQAYGLPAAGMGVRLDRGVDGSWITVGDCATGADGQVDQWSRSLEVLGSYRLEFGTDAYFAGLGLTPVYTGVCVEFRVPSDCSPCRMGLLVTPAAYHAYWQR